jgi:hypothetical protein
VELLLRLRPAADFAFREIDMHSVMDQTADFYRVLE